MFPKGQRFPKKRTIQNLEFLCILLTQTILNYCLARHQTVNSPCMHTLSPIYPDLLNNKT